MTDYRVEKENEKITHSGIEFFEQKFPRQLYEENDFLFSSHIHSAMEMLFVTAGSVSFFADDRE